MEGTIKIIFNTCDEGMDWIGLAQNRDRRQAVVYVVMNHGFTVSDILWP
jgi:hypothetical protein